MKEAQSRTPMRNANLLSVSAGALVLLALLLVLAACGDAPTATPAPMATPTTAASTAVPTPTPAATVPSPTPVSTAAAGSAVWPGGLDIDADTTLQELFDAFTDAEQSCIREALGDGFEQVLAQAVVSEDSGTAAWDAAVFPCLEEETARTVLVSSTLAAVTFGQGMELSEGDASCIWEYLSDIDVAGLVDAPEDAPEMAEFQATLFICVPSLVTVIFGLNPGSLNEEETSCIRELDLAAWMAAPEDSPESDDFVSGLISCVSGFSAVSETTVSLDGYAAWCAESELSENEDITATELADIIAAAKAVSPPAEVLEYHSRVVFMLRAYKGLLDLEAEDDSIFFLLFFPLGLVQEAEDNLPSDVRARLVEAGCIEQGAGEEEDDHGNDFESATPVAVGEAVEGSLGVGGDRDAFVFQAEANQNYEVDLGNYAFGSIGSATGPLIAVYGPDGRELTRTDDLFRPVAWQAGATGNYYVVVGDGARNGSYTLTVASATPAPAPEVLKVVTPTPNPAGDRDRGDSNEDAIGFVVPEAYGVTSALELDGATVCALSGSQAALNLADFAERNNLNLVTMTFGDIETVLAAYLTGRCDAATASRLQLATLIDALAPDPGTHVILP